MMFTPFSLSTCSCAGSGMVAGITHTLHPVFTAASRAPMEWGDCSTLPSSVSSPAIMMLMVSPPYRSFCLFCFSMLQRMEQASGRSSNVLSLVWLAGLRLTRILLCGNLKLQLRSAQRTRSRASLTLAPGRPVMSKPGKPFLMLHSTMTLCPV